MTGLGEYVNDNVVPIDKINASECQAKGVRHRSQLTVIPFETAVELQGFIVKAARKEDVPPSALAQLARAWSELEDRKRIIKMKPAPKPIDVQAMHAAKTKRQKPATAFDYGQLVASDTTTPSVPADKPSPEGHKTSE